MDRRESSSSSSNQLAFQSQSGRDGNLQGFQRFCRSIISPGRKSLATLLVLLIGCVGQTRVQLPTEDLFSRGQLRVHHDFELTGEHRLIGELADLRGDLLSTLALPSSDEAIHIFLFENEDQFNTYVSSNFPQFPIRRAFFTRTDTRLSVYAFWGDQVGDDLRHETTHAYLHAVVPQIPLWLDEGLAEYHELPRGSRGLHREHLALLARKRMEGTWIPDLPRLELLASSGEMKQIDYAEAWLWTHFLLQASPEVTALTQQKLQQLHHSGQATPWSNDLQNQVGDLRAAADTHLQHLLRLYALPPRQTQTP